MNTYKKCHNKRCGKSFTKLRVNQKHCDSICKERCNDCRLKHQTKRNGKLRVLRRERAAQS